MYVYIYIYIYIYIYNMYIYIFIYIFKKKHGTMISFSNVLKRWSFDKYRTGI